MNDRYIPFSHASETKLTTLPQRLTRAERPMETVVRVKR